MAAVGLCCCTQEQSRGCRDWGPLSVVVLQLRSCRDWGPLSSCGDWGPLSVVASRLLIVVTSSCWERTWSPGCTGSVAVAHGVRCSVTCESSQTRGQTCVSCKAHRFFTTGPPGKSSASFLRSAAAADLGLTSFFLTAVEYFPFLSLPPTTC